MASGKTLTRSRPGGEAGRTVVGRIQRSRDRQGDGVDVGVGNPSRSSAPRWRSPQRPCTGRCHRSPAPHCCRRRRARGRHLPLWSNVSRGMRWWPGPSVRRDIRRARSSGRQNRALFRTLSKQKSTLLPLSAVALARSGRLLVCSGGAPAIAALPHPPGSTGNANTASATRRRARGAARRRSAIRTILLLLGYGTSKRSRSGIGRTVHLLADKVAPSRSALSQRIFYRECKMSVHETLAFLGFPEYGERRTR